MSRIASITNAASSENRAIREEIAYMGTMSMIRITILCECPNKCLQRRNFGNGRTFVSMVFDSS